MPELPDVEGFRRTATAAAGRRVERVEVLDPSVLRNVAAAGLARAVVGHRLGEPRRRGKWLLLPVDGSAVLLHFGMTGVLGWREGSSGRSARHRHDRVVLVTSAGELVYRDQRKLQGLWLARGEGELAALLGRLGPDALGLDLEALEAALAGRRGGLKAALLDQSTVAGLGNLSVDEILWRARLHPQRPVGGLGRAERRALQRAMAAVLAVSARRGAIPDTPRWLTSQRRAPDPRCPRCSSRLETSRVGGRRTLSCPVCQPAPGAGTKAPTHGPGEIR